MRLALVAALIAFAAGCGERRSEIERRQAREQAEFCAKLTAAVTSGDEAQLKAALTNPPAELKEAAKTIRDSGPRSGRFDAAAAEIFGYAQGVCEPQGSRKLAPPASARIEGLTLCGGTTFPAAPEGGAGSGMVIYGDTSAPDPYQGQMVGLLWDPAGSGGHAGAGPSRPVTVHGQPGVAAPITVFQRTVLPELGTVIAWTEGDREFGLYGRGWSLDEADELVAMANGVEDIDRRSQIPDGVLPEGFGVLFAGSQEALDIASPLSLYSVRYRAANRILTVSGMGMKQEEFDAIRFLAIGLEETDAGGRPGLVGDAWPGVGPSVVTWREPDGLVVRVVGLGIPIESAKQVAAATRELNDDEWNAVTKSTGACGGP